MSSVFTSPKSPKSWTSQEVVMNDEKSKRYHREGHCNYFEHFCFVLICLFLRQLGLKSGIEKYELMVVKNPTEKI